MPVAYIGVGSNLGEREQTIRLAIERLRKHPRIALLAVSSLRETDPVGPVADQPRFLNGAVAVETDLPPGQLLEQLLEIERRLGRTRDAPPFGPRTIDLDLLLYADLQVQEPDLVVPHPRLAGRRFVLEPLVELDPGLVVPGRGPVATLLRELESAS